MTQTSTDFMITAIIATAPRLALIEFNVRIYIFISVVMIDSYYSEICCAIPIHSVHMKTLVSQMIIFTAMDNCIVTIHLLDIKKVMF